MSEQVRRPGRPRKGHEKRERVFWTISREVVAALDQVTDNQSDFVDSWLRQQPQVAEQLKQNLEEFVRMRNINISHRGQGYGYILVIEGVQETILLGADDLLFFLNWCRDHQQELDQEAKEVQDRRAARLLKDE